MAQPPKDEHQPGVIARAATLLGALAMAGESGLRLVDLAGKAGIARPTVHRLLTALADVGYVTQSADRRYRLGPTLFHLGLAAPDPVHDWAAVRRVAQKLAAVTGDTTYVSIRHFDGVYYLLREHGPFPARIQMVSVDSTHPFTASYSGIALLAHAPADTQRSALEEMYTEDPEETTPREVRRELVIAQLEASKQGRPVHGSGLVLPGVAGIAMAIPARDVAPYVAVAVSSIDHRMPESRIPELTRQITAAASDIARIMHA